MGLQLIFVVESNRRCASDWMYIKAAIDKCYDIVRRKDINISVIYMNGKGNFNKRDVIRGINERIKGYSALGESKVIYCFDTDAYESSSADNAFLSNVEKYCKDNNFEFVWFCHDIEEVFTGDSVEKGKKKDTAKGFILHDGMSDVDVECLRASKRVKGKSNLIKVLEDVFGN